LDDLERTRTIEINRVLGAAIRLQAHLEECFASLGVAGALVTWEVPAWDHFDEALLIAVIRGRSPLRLRISRAQIESFSKEEPDGPVSTRLRAAARALIAGTAA
jgi:hypothetical protein